MNKNIKNILIRVCCLSFVFLPLMGVVFAQTNSPSTQTQLETPKGPGTSADQPLITCGNAGQDPCTVNDLNKLIQDILNLVFMFASFIVAAMFMYAGFLLITSVGDTGKIQKAKEIFRRVIVGFLIMMLAYLIVKNLVANLVGEGGSKEIKDLFMNLFK